jgi:transcriptional regulator with XRE-family HTH domain
MTSYFITAYTKAARALLGWSQQELAQQAGIATSTVADFERGERTPVPANMDAIKSALERGGITFLEGGPVVGRPTATGAKATKGVPVRFVDATDLSQWAERRDSQSKMPELLTRLIRAEKGASAQLRFPSDEGITTSGWDGYCQVEDGTQFIPGGASAWEIGTQKNKISAKATEDYNKRTLEVDADDRSSTTFIFVTPRQWTKKSQWAKERIQENKWVEVRVYDAHDLVHWIELYPAVGHWIATQVRKRPAGSREIEEAWQDWALSTKWPMIPQLVLAGRDSESARMLKWLHGEAAVLTVEADTSAEAIAFLYATIDQLPRGYREHYLYRCLIADQPDAARRLGDSISTLVIAIGESEPGLAAHLASKGHHVYVAFARNATRSDASISLPRAKHEEFKNALIQMKIEKVLADKLTRDTARSLSVLRRLIPSVASQEIPKWAEPQYAANLIPALLAGSWDESREGDKKALEQLGACSYELIQAKLLPWLTKPDPLLRKAGSAWTILAPLDAWFRLAPHITSTQIERYMSVAVDILGSIDPRFAMGQEDRWLAGVRNQLPPCSTLLQSGISETLILLSLYGDHLSAVQHGSRRAELIVRKLLTDASAERWWSISGSFRMLAEASPEAFLDVLDESLALPDPPVMVLFKEDDGFFGGAYHSNLLWALETLAWSREYLPRSAELLAKLAALDPGGKYANRPHASLVNIFRLWMPQTHANSEIRLRVLDRLRKAEANISWKLLLDLLPRGGEIGHPTPQPRWRDFSNDDHEEITWAVLRKGGEHIAERLLMDVGDDAKRWEELIKHYPQLPPEKRKEALGRLTEANSRFDSEPSREEIWTALRQLLNHHRSFPDTNWALPGPELDEIEKVYLAFEPADDIAKSAWLFSEYIANLTRPVPNDWRANEALSSKIRRESVESIYRHSGYDGILNLVRIAKYPHLVAHALTQTNISRDERESMLKQALLSKEPPVVNFAGNLINYLVSQEGEEWAQTAITEATRNGSSVTTLVKLLHLLPTKPETWKIVSALGNDVESEYWRTLPIIGVDNGPESVQVVLDKLLSAGRPRNAAVFAAYNKAKVPSDLIIRILTAAATCANDNKTDREDGVMLTFAIEELLQQIDGRQDIPEEQVANVEWAFLALLEHSRRPPVVLHRLMSSKPSFFVEVLSAAFHATNQERPIWPPDEAERRRNIASHAHRLLDSWNKIPGDNGSTIDGLILSDWIKEARKLCNEADRARIGDQFIGAMLSTGSRDNDKIWFPAIPVREVIEKVRSRDLELGIQVAIHNSRGVTTRDPLEGGEQERAIAQKFRAYSKSISIDWPRTSALLERIARSFEDDAKIHDNDAQLTDWSY